MDLFKGYSGPPIKLEHSGQWGELARGSKTSVTFTASWSVIPLWITTSDHYINSDPGLTPQLYYRIQSCQTDNAHCHIFFFWVLFFFRELVFYSILGSLGTHWWPGLNRVWIYRSAGGLLTCLTGFDFIDIFGLWSWAGIDYIDLVGDTFWEGFRFITIESHHPGQRGNTDGDIKGN